MKNIIKYSILIFLLFLLGVCSQNLTQQANRGNRIISLSPHITEIIYALGADKDLIAVTSFCNYPPQAKGKEKIGGLFDPNVEKIVSLAPTHLIGVPAHQKLDQDLHRFNMHIIMLASETVAEVIHTIDTLGQILGYENQAGDLIKHINDDLLLRSDKKKQHQPLSAMLVIGKEPGSLQNLMVAGPETFIDELWSIAGGINAFADLPVRYSTVNLEAIIQRNPQVIILFAPNRPVGIYESYQEPEWQYFKNVEAVKKGHLYTIGGDYVFIPGPRLTLLAQDFSGIIERVTR